MTSPATEANHREAVYRGLVAAGAFVLVVAGIKAAAIIVNPILFAAFLAIIFAPPFLWMRARGLPTLLALLLLGAVLVVVGTLVVVIVQASFLEFYSRIDTYVAELDESKRELLQRLRLVGINLPSGFSFGELEPRVVAGWTQQALNMARGLLTGAFIVLFIVLFALLESASFPNKLTAIHDNSQQALQPYRVVLTSVHRYLLLKTFICALTGILIYGFLKLMGIDAAEFWAFVAFLLNYIPNIGSLVAAIPAVTLAFITRGWDVAVYTALGYLAVNTLCGNLLEPRMMGRGVGLSPLIVFVSLLFWGYVLGPVGMFLSVPLTMAIKIALASYEETQWLAILLGPEVSEPKAATPSAVADEEIPASG